MPQIQTIPGFGSLGTKNTYSICSNCSLIDTLNKILKMVEMERHLEGSRPDISTVTLGGQNGKITSRLHRKSIGRAIVRYLCGDM